MSKNNFENCGYYIDDECTICGMGTDGEDTFCKYCKDNPNCYYKQLAELKAENERLKAQLNVLEEDNKKLSSENDALYNNSLQEVKEDLVKRVWNLQTGNKELAHYLACMTEQRNRANTCLQEIKEIAEKPKPFKDFSEIKTATEVEYDYAVICNELKLRLHKVLELITKAESDG